MDNEQQTNQSNGTKGGKYSCSQHKETLMYLMKNGICVYPHVYPEIPVELL